MSILYLCVFILNPLIIQTNFYLLELEGDNRKSKNLGQGASEAYKTTTRPHGRYTNLQETD